MVGVRSFLFFPFSLSPPCPTKNSIAGNRTRGTNVKGLYVTNYTTMDVYYIACVFSSFPFSLLSLPPPNVPPLPDALLFVPISVIHCGVVGNIQAFHVCAPGSIPGDGVFLSSPPPFYLITPSFPYLWIPTIAQLVERRTVVVNRFP